MKCPIDGGPLLDWRRAPYRYPWYCPNNDVHGGNGQFFTNEDIGALQKMDEILNKVLPSVLDNTISFDDAVKIIARRSMQPEPTVRARLAVAAKLARNYTDLKKGQTPQPRATTQGLPKPTAGGTVAPDEFMAVMKAHKLTKKQAAVAIGRSVSRVHELTVTKGGSQQLLELFKQKLAAYEPPTE